MKVRTLIGSRQLSFSLRCLSSLVQYSADPVELVVHSDGSLTPDDCRRLRDALPIDSIVTREEADAAVLPLLADLPSSRRYRETQPFALKLFDVSLLERDILRYCDSDILFTRRFTGLFELPADTDCLFMRDYQNAYSLYPWHVRPIGRHRLVSYLNAGLMCQNPARFDLARIEEILSDLSSLYGARTRACWLEQTCWAIFAGALRCRLYDRHQIAMAHPRIPYLSEAVGVHFIGSFRGLLDHFAPRPDESGVPVAIRTHPAGHAGVVTMIGQEISNRIQRIRGS